MLVAATVIFSYYTIWTLLMVRIAPPPFSLPSPTPWSSLSPDSQKILLLLFSVIANAETLSIALCR